TTDEGPTVVGPSDRGYQQPTTMPPPPAPPLPSPLGATPTAPSFAPQSMGSAPVISSAPAPLPSPFAPGAVPAPVPAPMPMPAPMPAASYGMNAVFAGEVEEPGTRALEVTAMLGEQVIDVRHFSNPQSGEITSTTKTLLATGGIAVFVALLIFFKT